MIEAENKTGCSILEHSATEFLEACPVCGSGDYHLVHNRGAFYNDITRTTNVETQICHCCGVLFTNPRLPEELVRKFYENEQGGLHNNQNLNELVKQKPKALTRVRMEFFNQWMTDVERVLEVGGGGLNFAVSMAKSYPDITFDELDPSLPQNDRLLPNLRLISEFLDLAFADALEDRYHAVVAFHVLEHQYKPKDFLQIIKRTLVDNGLLFLEVPYPFSPFWMRKPIDACFRTVHPFNFTLRSIQYLLESAGFEILSQDMSSFTMVRIAARVGKAKGVLIPLSSRDLSRIDRFMNSWKIYSRLVRIKPFAKPAHLYAEWAWYRSKNVNML